MQSKNLQPAPFEIVRHPTGAGTGWAPSPGISLRQLRGAFFCALIVFSFSGCGALLLVGGAGTSAIAFATGELRATEEAPITAVDDACQSATRRLGYEDVTIDRKADSVRLRATTASGDPVVIRLLAQGPERTDLRIRIGTFGDEAASRLVLEEIHQSL